MRTILTNELISKHTLEQVRHLFLLRSAFNEALNTIHEHIEEFVNVLLNIQINGTSIIILESSAEFLGIEVLLLYLHEAAKNAFDLMKHIFLGRFFICFLILDLYDKLPECGNHKQILHDAVHVANAARILKPNVT